MGGTGAGRSPATDDQPYQVQPVRRYPAWNDKGTDNLMPRAAEGDCAESGKVYII